MQVAEKAKSNYTNDHIWVQHANTKWKLEASWSARAHGAGSHGTASALALGWHRSRVEPVALAGGERATEPGNGLGKKRRTCVELSGIRSEDVGGRRNGAEHDSDLHPG